MLRNPRDAGEFDNTDKKLQILEITGNPFARQFDYANLEKTLKEEVGAAVLNHDVAPKKVPYPKPIAYIDQKPDMAPSGQLFRPELSTRLETYNLSELGSERAEQEFPSGVVYLRTRCI